MAELDMKGIVLISAIIIAVALILSTLIPKLSMLDTGALENITLQVNITEPVSNYSSFTYGELYGEDFTLVISEIGVYVNVTPLTGIHSNGVNVANSKMTIINSGTYKIDSQMSFSDGANTEFHLSLGVNGSTNENHCHAQRKLGTGGDVGSVSFTCIDELNKDDEITIMIENVDNTNNVDIADVNINIIRVE